MDDEIAIFPAAARAMLEAMATTTDYAGASGRLTLERLGELGAGYYLQPKVDGQYVRVTLDGRGRIANVFARSGRPVDRRLWLDICDPIGEPWSELVGELEAHTEAGNRAAAARGWRCIHLFDLVRAGRSYVAGEPYRVRRDLLCRMHYALADRPRELAWRDRYRDARGRFLESAPHGPERTPIVPQYTLGRADELWAQVDTGELEGMVAVAQEAPLGRRRSKLKIKPTDTLDAVVLQASRRRATVTWAGQVFTVGTAGKQLRAGDVVAIAHNGFYESGCTPRFPRVERLRTDMV